MENSLEHITTGDTLCNRTPRAQALKSMINKSDHMKLKSFCKANNIVNRTKYSLENWKKNLTSPTCDRDNIQIM